MTFLGYENTNNLEVSLVFIEVKRSGTSDELVVDAEQQVENAYRSYVNSVIGHLNVAHGMSSVGTRGRLWMQDNRASGRCTECPSDPISISTWTPQIRDIEIAF